MAIRRALLWMLVASFVAAALAGAAMALDIGFAGGYEAEVFGTGALLGVFCGVQVIFALLKGRRGSRLVPIIGMVTSTIALVWMLALIWTGFRSAMFFNELGLAASAFSVAFTSVALALLVPVRGRIGGITRIGTTACSLLAATVFSLGVWERFEWFDYLWSSDGEALFRLTTFFSVFAAAGLVTRPILWKIQQYQRDETEEHTLENRPCVELVCPRCGERQTLRCGKSQCASCGLRIEIKVEEPRCACGYLLLGLTSATCPECGAAVKEVSALIDEHVHAEGEDGS